MVSFLRFRVESGRSGQEIDKLLFSLVFLLLHRPVVLFFGNSLSDVPLDGLRAGAESRTAAVLVFGEQRHARERLAALLARVALDVRVRLQVGAQVGPVGEGARAVRTREGLLARVGADVALQQPRPREGLAAEHALAGQRVRADVHLERAQRHVDLVAVLAAERLFGLVGGAVQFLVLGQAAIGRVRLVAVGALVARRRRGGGGRGQRRRRGRRLFRPRRFGAALAAAVARRRQRRGRRQVLDVGRRVRQFGGRGRFRIGHGRQQPLGGRRLRRTRRRQVRRVAGRERRQLLAVVVVPLVVVVLHRIHGTHRTQSVREGERQVRRVVRLLLLLLLALLLLQLLVVAVRQVGRPLVRLMVQVQRLQRADRRVRRRRHKRRRPRLDRLVRRRWRRRRRRRRRSAGGQTLALLLGGRVPVVRLQAQVLRLFVERRVVRI